MSAKEGTYQVESDQNTAEINVHKGILAVLLIIVCGSVAGGWYLVDKNDQKNREDRQILNQEVTKIREASQKIDKTFTAYMAGNTQRINAINRRVTNCEESDADIEKRLRALELRR